MAGFEPVTGRNILRTLAKFGLDNHLTPQDQAELPAFISLLENELYDALLYSWWLELDNLEQTGKAFTDNLGFIHRFIPTQVKQRTRMRLSRARTIALPQGETSSVYLVAHDVFKALDRRLGDKDFFYGKLLY
jgi:hypothetical protein